VVTLGVGGEGEEHLLEAGAVGRPELAQRDARGERDGADLVGAGVGAQPACGLVDRVSGTVQGGGETVIGDGCLFMAYSHVGHDCRVGDGAIIANSVALAGHVIVEDHVHISGLAAAHQFCRIGRLAFVSGLTGVTMDVPPYCTAVGTRAELAGLNAVGLQRAGMSEEQIGRVKAAYKILFRSNLGLAEALAQVDGELGAHPEIAHLVAFIRGSQRGITR